MAVEAYSKWINAMVLCSSALNTIIQQLRMLLAENGLPENIVADNGTWFLSANYEENCIQHITSPIL